MNRPNEFTSAGYPSGDGAIVWQPVTMGPNGHPNNNVVTDGRKPANYPGMPTIAINIFSACCILLGVASIGVQIAALVIYAEYVYNYVWFAADVAGTGILSGSFCVIAGSLGIASTKKRTKSLLVWTVVMSGLSVAFTVAASIVFGIAASDGIYYYCYYNVYPSSLCSTWESLEWSLMGINIAVSIDSIVLLVLTSVSVCCGRRSNSTARNNQQGMFYGTATGQQPVYFQPQPMQQQQPNYQMAYVPQHIQQQQPPQMHLVAAPTAHQQPMHEKQTPVVQQQAKADETLDVMVHPAK
ncbi:uncharacterized protein LOC124209286 [Daphnia pulex]|uniref:uncharacterized protein LOC124209286 n=1 Tax=Daphnia pulex TaxID=6669 RepID=UPI001EE04BA0|nr:uncharacterized protein LOC124209286 [Daphnia pulex]